MCPKAAARPTDPGVWPLVSIGIPLYRSRRFVGVIADNVERISYPNLEFLIADQHGEDDALPLLRERFADDPRVRFFATGDRLNWSENYNFLLRRAKGRYFRWLAHDDSLPARGLEEQVACLERDPETVLVYGPVEWVDTTGRTVDLVGRARTFPFDHRRPWGLRESLLIYVGVCGVGAFKGLVRRRRIVEAGFSIRTTHGHVAPERVWLFAISLLGRFRFAHGYVYRKQLTPGSVSTGFRMSLRNHASCYRVGLSYLRDRYPARARRLVVSSLLGLATLVRIVYRGLWGLFPAGRLRRHKLRLLAWIERREAGRAALDQKSRGDELKL